MVMFLGTYPTLEFYSQQLFSNFLGIKFEINQLFGFISIHIGYRS